MHSAQPPVQPVRPMRAAQPARPTHSGQPPAAIVWPVAVVALVGRLAGALRWPWADRRAATGIASRFLDAGVTPARAAARGFAVTGWRTARSREARVFAGRIAGIAVIVAGAS